MGTAPASSCAEALCSWGFSSSTFVTERLLKKATVMAHASPASQRPIRKPSGAARVVDGVLGEALDHDLSVSSENPERLVLIGKGEWRADVYATIQPRGCPSKALMFFIASLSISLRPGQWLAM